ncbi:unnamed protein product [Dovyalis caffra]|uniref:Gnk2-homologous domain-containing protein n=1 Tax=Dovyalis caffra TaxID=77055 RepID=A0AAV1SAJ0_9ROSI|nr:unnamed protein product [Dovyalis caffra]
MATLSKLMSSSMQAALKKMQGDLKTTDCSRCIESAVNQISLVCPYSYGAALQLEGCYARYEHNDFLGRLDTSLRYKKCSKSVNNDVEFFKRRDDVLADLQTAMGFKVSSSGSVEGYAQCLGDLSSSDCSSCLADAVGQLKNLCGSAAAADVYLGQCYARYWASGYYDLSSDSSNDDDVGKTIAIIVGILAGLAILIVLLSFCRKTMGHWLNTRDGNLIHPDEVPSYSIPSYSISFGTEMVCEIRPKQDMGQGRGQPIAILANEDSNLHDDSLWLILPEKG